MLEIEKEEYTFEHEEEILSYYMEQRDAYNLEGSGLDAITELKEYLQEAKEEVINDNLLEIEEKLYCNDIYQYFIINDPDTWNKYTNYPIYYSYDLDMYLLGVTHWGTSWSFFFTDAPRPQHMKIPEYEEILSGTTSTA